MILSAALLSKDKRFQELVLILNPMLEETFLCMQITKPGRIEYLDQCGRYCSKKLNLEFPKPEIDMYDAKTKMLFEINNGVIYELYMNSI